MAEPSITGKALMNRLAEQYPVAYASKVQLRTLQRRVKIWRSARATELIVGTLSKAPATAEAT